MGIKVLWIYPNTYGMNILPPAIALFKATTSGLRLLKLIELIERPLTRVLIPAQKHEVDHRFPCMGGYFQNIVELSGPSERLLEIERSFSR